MAQLAAPVSAIHRLVWTSLLAALIAVGAFISIPIAAVPVTLQGLFVLLAGLVLGPRGGIIATLLYMAAGLMGLPVFTGGKAGLAVFLGPTGGFLTGFILQAFFSGIAGGGQLKSIRFTLLCCLAGTLLMLALGSLRLVFVMNISFAKAFAVGVLPYLPGDICKCLAAVSIYRFLAARRLLPL